MVTSGWKMVTGGYRLSCEIFHQLTPYLFVGTAFESGKLANISITKSNILHISPKW